MDGFWWSVLLVVAFVVWTIGWLVGPVLAFVAVGLGSAGGRVKSAVAQVALLSVTVIAASSAGVWWLTRGEPLYRWAFVLAPPVVLVLAFGSILRRQSMPKDHGPEQAPPPPASVNTYVETGASSSDDELTRTLLSESPPGKE